VSLPGLTRQSILLISSIRFLMDARVKPAHDLRYDYAVAASAGILLFAPAR
jgi:hypothetical protein